MQAAINGQCARVTQLSMPLPPPGVRWRDIDELRASNFTRGDTGSSNMTSIFWGKDPAGTIAYANALNRAYDSAVQFAACNARLSPTVGGVFLITLATLCYGAWRRGQIRKRFNLPGDAPGDWAAWLFCTQCAACQEYRTMRMHNVEDGVWGGRVGWLLDGSAVLTTVTSRPNDVEMGKT